MTEREAPRVFLASRNAAKIAEMQRILRRELPDLHVLGLEDVTPYEEPAETEPTFVGNARIKALAGVAATGLPSLADDSGLCVAALNAMPGVLSARWAGVTGSPRQIRDRANNELLLAQLSDVPDERRGAEFVCAVVLAVPDVEGGPPAEHVVQGRMQGRVIREMRGGGGFGYDAVFCADGHQGTTAELPVHEKDAISHRGKALAAMAVLVAEMLV